MWFSKIKKKKVQFILMATVLCITALSLATCINIIMRVVTYVEDYYKDNKDIILFSYDEEQASDIEGYLNEQGMKTIDTVGYSIDKNVYLQNKNLNISLGFIIEVNQIDINPWDILVTEGKKEEAPTGNEIWVQKLMADAEDIKLGDTIKVKAGDNFISFQVTAFVNDSLQPSSVVGYNNFYISNEYGKKINQIQKLHILAFDYKTHASRMIDELKNYLGESIKGEFILMQTITSAAVITSSTIGGIGLIASILIFIVAIIVIRYILWNNILKEYRAIGIYKAIGFSPSKISNIYLMAYGSTGIFAIIIGSILSMNFARRLIKDIVKYIGIYSDNQTSLFVISGTIVFMSLVFLLNLKLILYRVKKINPVQALTIGVVASKKKLKPSLIKDSIKPWALAINDIYKYKEQNFIIWIVLSLVAFLSLFFVNIDYSVANISKNIPAWFGIVLGDVNIDCNDTLGSYQEIVDSAKKDDRVRGGRYGRYGIKDIITIDTQAYNIQKEQLIYYAYNSYEDQDGFTCSILEGKNPQKNNEVALSKSVLKDSGLKIGDEITMKVDEQQKSFIITGSYTSVFNDTYSFRVLLKTIPKELIDGLDPNVTLTFYDEAGEKEFLNEIKDRYPDVIIEKIPTEIKNGLADLEIVSPIAKLILITILFFSLLNIINMIVMNNADNRRQYGIMKALGFSTGIIIKRTVYRIAFISFFAMIVGGVVNNLLGGIIFRSAIMGIDGMMISGTRSFATIIIIYVLIIFATFLSMLSIRTISTVELMEE